MNQPNELTAAQMGEHHDRLCDELHDLQIQHAGLLAANADLRQIAEDSQAGRDSMRRDLEQAIAELGTERVKSRVDDLALKGLVNELAQMRDERDTALLDLAQAQNGAAA